MVTEGRCGSLQAARRSRPVCNGEDKHAGCECTVVNTLGGLCGSPRLSNAGAPALDSGTTRHLGVARAGPRQKNGSWRGGGGVAVHSWAAPHPQQTPPALPSLCLFFHVGALWRWRSRHRPLAGVGGVSAQLVHLPRAHALAGSARACVQGAGSDPLTPSNSTALLGRHFGRHHLMTARAGVFPGHTAPPPACLPSAPAAAHAAPSAPSSPRGGGQDG